MTQSLIDIQIPSIYNNGPLPSRMAKCTPDTRAGILAIAADVRAKGHELRLSDLFRSYDMQKQSHEDWRQGKKKAYSPPPGGSMHEAGRAIDIDLASVGMALATFWKVARAHGFEPIIQSPNPGQSEAWHFDRRGSHHAVYEYVVSGKAGRGVSAYAQMSVSSILQSGIPVDSVKDQDVARLQSGLIRLGFDAGCIDGVLGETTMKAIEQAGCTRANAMDWVTAQLRQRFPEEYAPVVPPAAGPKG